MSRENSLTPNALKINNSIGSIHNVNSHNNLNSLNGNINSNLNSNFSNSLNTSIHSNMSNTSNNNMKKKDYSISNVTSSNITSFNNNNSNFNSNNNINNNENNTFTNDNSANSSVNNIKLSKTKIPDRRAQRGSGGSGAVVSKAQIHQGTQNIPTKRRSFFGTAEIVLTTTHARDAARALELNQKHLQRLRRYVRTYIQNVHKY